MVDFTSRLGTFNECHHLGSGPQQLCVETPVTFPGTPTADNPEYRHWRAQRAIEARWAKPHNRERQVQSAERYIRKLVDAAPPLTDEQRVRLIALLAPGAAASREEVSTS